MASTLLLDRDAWDLCLDALGNIAVATAPYQPVQDAASAARVFSGEAYYDATLGVPYLDQVFSGVTPLAVLRQRMAMEAERVPGVASATAAIRLASGRTVTGQLRVTLDDGTVQTAAL